MSSAHDAPSTNNIARWQKILEDILIRVARLAKRYEATHSGSQLRRSAYIGGFRRYGGESYSLQPAATLASISTVSRVFNATIKGSPKLQRAITGDLDPVLHNIYASPSLSIKWLLEHAFSKFKDQNWDLESPMEFSQASSECRQLMKEFRKSYAKFPQASWRNVLAYQPHYEDSAERFWEIKVEFRRPKGCDINIHNKYVEEIDVGSGTTLGELFEILAGISCRSGPQNVAAQKRIAKAERIREMRKMMKEIVREDEKREEKIFNAK